MLYTRNFLLPFWIIFLLGPSNPIIQEDNTEVDKRDEKKFMNSKMFFIPLHLVIYINTFIWLWALAVVSDNIKVDHWLITIAKPETNLEFITLSLSVGVLAALDSISGHELFHKREGYNKLVGQFAFTKYFYSHFFDEHLQGHHKAVATPEDPATALYG